MLAILNYLNTHNFPIFQPILMTLVSKLKAHRALSDQTHLSLGLLSPLRMANLIGSKPEVKSFGQIILRPVTKFI